MLTRAKIRVKMNSIIVRKKYFL